MDYGKQKARLLDLVRAGKITAAEAARLLRARWRHKRSGVPVSARDRRWLQRRPRQSQQLDVREAHQLTGRRCERFEQRVAGTGKIDFTVPQGSPDFDEHNIDGDDACIQRYGGGIGKRELQRRSK
jgi:hypothetical protein